MKDYKILYEFYPFNVENLSPKEEIIKANSLDEAFEKMETKYGDKIEIFKAPARKFYNE